MLSIPRKLYGRVIINSVKERINSAIEEEQTGIREGRGCADHCFNGDQKGQV